jgi:hypothetical protein
VRRLGNLDLGISVAVQTVRRFGQAAQAMLRKNQSPYQKKSPLYRSTHHISKFVLWQE